MMSAFRGRSQARFARTLAALALFALLAPTAGLLANQQLAGWTPTHGHLGNRTVIATHQHPYDNHPAIDQLIVADAGSETDAPSSDDLVFTPADDAGGTSGLALARKPASLPTPAPVVAARRTAQPGPFEAAADLVPTPPPRV